MAGAGGAWNASDAYGCLLPFVEQRLQFLCLLDEVFHAGRSFMNQACCSMSPEVGWGGKFFTASRNKPAVQSIMLAVSAARMSASRTLCSSGAA